MQASNKSKETRHAGKPLCVPNDVDRAGVPTTSEHHQATPTYVHDQRLVVLDPRIGEPPFAIPGLMGRRHSSLEVRGSVHFASDEDRVIDEQGWVPSLEDGEPLAVEASTAQCGQLLGFAAGNLDPSLGPHAGVYDHRQ